MTATRTAPFRFSVIVASRGRPEWLQRCLLSLRQQDYPVFEIVVVSESNSLAGLSSLGVKTVPFEDANLAIARNKGIAFSSGEICAFIDDDAVAEPLWLYRLSEAFAATSADAVVGYVRGRNGISFQSRVAFVDAEAETHAALFDGEQSFVPDPPQGQALKLVGTNMAVRREALLAQRGFDQAFRFFLEDTDLSLRLAQGGCKLAVAPLAEVHHGFAASARRTRQRAPLDLFDVGRSTSYYLHKHLGRADGEFWDRLKQRELKRLARHLVAGTCEPRDVRHCLARLKAGWEDGSDVKVGETADFLDGPEVPFVNVSESHKAQRILSSYWFHKRRSLCQTAEKIVKNGEAATVLSFSLTSVRHHVSYDNAGFWLQTGGLFGPSDRDAPVFKRYRFAERVQNEIRRVAKRRGIGDCDDRKWWEHLRH
ncbi:MAG: glycosyltransferase family 2 protein [Pseudomonadota bacterium]